MANWISAILFAIEALGFVGVLFLLHRIIRTAKRRSEAINMADKKPSVPSVGGRTENDKTELRDHTGR